MGVRLKAFLFFFLAVAKGESNESDYLRQLISEHPGEARDVTRFFPNLYKLFFRKMEAVEMNILSELRNETDQLDRKLSYLFPIRVRTEVEDISGFSGTIEFVGEKNLDIKRKIWVLKGDGTSHRSPASFVMEENNLGDNAHLSLWGSDPNANRHVWNGLRADWRKETTTGGSLILLTLTVKSSATPSHPPSFKLRFDTTRATTSRVHSGIIMRKDGIQSVSFPYENAKDYPPGDKSSFQALIAPANSRPFSLTTKYLDVPGTPPACSDNIFWVFFLEESPSETNYRKVDASTYRQCGHVGNTSELLGTSTVAIIRFYAMSRNTGKGFRVEMKTN